MSRIAQIQSLLQSAPQDLFLHHALALEWIREGNDAEARKAFQHNLDCDPNYLPTYYHLGRLEARAGNEEKARTLYEQGMQVAISQKDFHTRNELEAALEDLD